MANNFIYLLINCKSQKTILVTTSARIALKYIRTGCRVDVWISNHFVRRIYASSTHMLEFYADEELKAIESKKCEQGKEATE